MLTLGLLAGVLGGMFGIGGGLIMVPALILVFDLDPKTATGTSLLAQLLPVGLLGVREYWRRGEVAITPGLWIAVGLAFGVLLGAKLTGLVPAPTMRRAYGAFMLVVGTYFLLAPQGASKRPSPPVVVQESPGATVDQVH
ncbi:MAG: sulfite exporter TauE/SafE family protein [Isosphaeraceae bacterium]|nr:sulfite exporter TauE/SafE family protein [Isosphaeraceae bacterium]